MKRRLFFVLVFAIVSTCLAGISDESWGRLQKNYYLMKIASTDAHVHYNLAMTYAYTGFIEEGFKQIAMIPSLDPTYKDKVVAKYATRVTRSPKDWESRFGYAFALYISGSKEAAVAEFLKVVDLTPDSSIKGWAYGYIAYIYGERKEWPKAMESIRTAITYEPDGAALYLAQGLAQKETGDTVGAVASLLRATTLQASQMMGKKSLRRLRDEK